MFRLKPGETIKRTDLHDEFGGRRQGGIGTSAKTENIFLFSSAAGQEFGYVDGWSADHEVFYYTGEGQEGDQKLTQGNKAILDSISSGKSLHLFDGSKGVVTYIGEFSLDQKEPYFLNDSTDVNSEIRQTIVFKLLPTEKQQIAQNIGHTQVAPYNRSVEPAQETISIESKHAESFTRPLSKESVGFRTEAQLTEDFTHYLMAQGINMADIGRNKITVPQSFQTLYTDIYITPLKMLIEAKGTTTRESIRMALGQLLDYERFIDVKSMAILVPSRVPSDLVELLSNYNIQVIYKDGSEFKFGDGTLFSIS